MDGIEISNGFLRDGKLNYSAMKPVGPFLYLSIGLPSWNLFLKTKLITYYQLSKRRLTIIAFQHWVQFLLSCQAPQDPKWVSSVQLLLVVTTVSEAIQVLEVLWVQRQKLFVLVVKYLLRNLRELWFALPSAPTTALGALQLSDFLAERTGLKWTTSIHLWLIQIHQCLCQTNIHNDDEGHLQQPIHASTTNNPT